MYHEFYQLRENPFNVTADPGFFYSSTVHTDALANLIFAIEQRKGICLITGEVGTGKTTLCRVLLRKLDHRTKTALVLNPRFNDFQLLQFIVKDLGIKGNFQNKYDLVNALNDFLLTQSNQGNNVVVIIDEAQNLTVSQLEQIRLLSNLETEKHKLLQIVLVGQPELAKKLHKNQLRQLNQRIIVRAHLTELGADDLKNYINHRLRLSYVGLNVEQPIIFSDSAMDAVYEYTHGTPRKINILCDRVLLAGYVRETDHIGEDLIHECAREVFA